MTYELEKKVWTDKDFDQMGWHDNHIYQISVAEDLALDIDYIFQWNKPVLEGLPFTFWIAPSTLVFKKIQNLAFNLDTAFHDTIEIQDIEREILENGTLWTIITQQGDFQFMSEGFQQFIRQEPFFQFGQTIPFLERFGRSVEQTTAQHNPNRFRNDIVEQQKRDAEHFENVKKRHLKKQEKEQLEKLRENNEIETKEYLKKKREIKEMLDYYDYWLKDTRFRNWVGEQKYEHYTK